MRLETTRLRTLHLFADGRDRIRVHSFGGQLALGDELLDRIDIDGAVHFTEKLRLLLGPVAITDRVDQQVSEGVSLEQLAEHVIDFAAQRSPRFLELLEEPAIHLAFAGVGGAQVPEMANLGLADAMNAAEALL